MSKVVNLNNNEIITVLEDEELLKEVKNVLRDKEDTIERLIKKIKDYESGDKYVELREEMHELWKQAAIMLSSKKELDAYKNYCHKHGSGNVVVNQYGTGIGMVTKLNYIDKEGKLVGEWEDITDVEVW